MKSCTIYKRRSYDLNILEVSYDSLGLAKGLKRTGILDMDKNLDGQLRSILEHCVMDRHGKKAIRETSGFSVKLKGILGWKLCVGRGIVEN